MSDILINSPRTRKLVLTEEQVSCLSSPTRKMLMSAFIEFGPATVAEIAPRVERRPKSLYYHVDLMLTTGLLRLVGHQAGVKKPEGIYDAVSDRLELAVGANESYREASRKSVQALIRLSSRQFDSAAKAGRGPLVTRATFRLSRADRVAFSERLRELIKWADERRSDSQPQTHVLILEIPE